MVLNFYFGSNIIKTILEPSFIPKENNLIRINEQTYVAYNVVFDYDDTEISIQLTKL